jgi:hypothetical protein
MSTEDSVAVKDVVDDCIEAPIMMPIKSSTPPPSNVNICFKRAEISKNRLLNSSTYSQSLQSLTTRQFKHSMDKKNKHSEKDLRSKVQNKIKSSEHLYYKFNSTNDFTMTRSNMNLADLKQARSINFLTQSDNYADRRETKTSSLNNDTLVSAKSVSSNSSNEIKSPRADDRSRKSSTGAYHLSMIFNNAYFDRCLDMPISAETLNAQQLVTSQANPRNEIKCSSSKSSIMSSFEENNEVEEENNYSDLNQVENIEDGFGMNLNGNCARGNSVSSYTSISSSKSRSSRSSKNRNNDETSECESKKATSASNNSDINLNSSIDSSMQDESNHNSNTSNTDINTTMIMKSGLFSKNYDSTVKKYKSNYESKSDEILEDPVAVNNRNQQQKKQAITSSSSDSDVSVTFFYF